jgi:hypothetical protein
MLKHGAPRDVGLAVLPLGTANDFASALGISMVGAPARHDLMGTFGVGLWLAEPNGGLSDGGPGQARPSTRAAGLSRRRRLLIYMQTCLAAAAGGALGARDASGVSLPAARYASASRLVRSPGNPILRCYMHTDPSFQLDCALPIIDQG